MHHGRHRRRKHHRRNYHRITPTLTLTLTCRTAACALVLAATLASATGAVTSPPADAGEPPAGTSSDRSKSHGPYVTELPPLNGQSGTTPGAEPAPDAATGIPDVALDAYKKAAEILDSTQPSCHLPWELLAGIGRVESVHAQGYGLAPDGTTRRAILGPRLDGKDFALIRDTDNGRWDGDSEFDRAVGPLQFIPSTWKTWGADGNADGKRDPGNIHDAALATGLYLCTGDRDLSAAVDRDRAVLSYNNSRQYVNTVLAWMRYYQQHTTRPTGSEARDGSAPEASADTPTPRNHATTSGPPDPQPTTPDEHAAKPKPHPELRPKPNPEPKPRSEPKPKPTTPTRPAPLGRLTAVRTTELTATADEDFPEPARTIAHRMDNTPAIGIKVRYTITGTTQAHFPDGTREATVTTDRHGIATAPRLTAGGQLGTFTLHAVITEHPAAKAGFTATVTARPADQRALPDNTLRPVAVYRRQ
ncbi:lytic transglycosylase [Streptomyces sp. NPDC050658]|uniref:lytic transglycosylase n=1 Tax=unclassified Streptomyces TaxID=2593676 RepID=UPI0034288341